MSQDMKANLPIQTLQAIDAMSAKIYQAYIHNQFMQLHRKSLNNLSERKEGK